MGILRDLRKQRDALKTLRWATEVGEYVSPALVHAAHNTPLHAIRERREARKTLRWATERGEYVSPALARLARKPTPLRDLLDRRRDAKLRRDFWWVD